MARPKKIVEDVISTTPVKKTRAKTTTTKKTTSPKSKSTTTTTKRVRKTPEQKEAEREQRKAARLLKREQKKEELLIQKEEEASLTKEIVEEIPHLFEESYVMPDSYVIVLTPQGNVYVEATPRYYSDFSVFCNFLASTPEVNENNLFQYRGIIKVSSFEGMDIVTSAYDSPKQLNHFAKKFPEIKNETSLVGGNIIFTGKGKPFTKRETKKAFEKIIERLQAEEEINLDDK